MAKLTPTQMMEKAKYSLLTNSKNAFYASIVLDIRHKWDDSIPTACASGTCIRYNTKFFVELTEKARVGLMLHEVMHIVYLHDIRLMGREPLKFNIAGDHVINLGLLEHGFELPEGGYADPKYTGMCTDEVYALLPDEPQSAAQKSMMDITFKDSKSSTKAAELEATVEDILCKAVMKADMSSDGSTVVPSGIRDMVNKINNAVLDWRIILSNYMNSYAKDDYSYRKCDKRYMPNYFLPSCYSESTGHIATFTDNSCSVSDKDLNVFWNENRGIKEKLNPELMTIASFDTSINNIIELHKEDSVDDIKFKGGGGTNIHPVLEWITKNKPQVTLIFTDGYFTMPGILDDVTTDIVWLIYDNNSWTADKGTVIHFDIDTAKKYL